MLDFESSKNATHIVLKPPRTLTKIEASLQSGQKELILNKWGPASYNVTQQESPAQERDQRCNSLAQEEGEGRDERRK